MYSAVLLDTVNSFSKKFLTFNSKFTSISKMVSDLKNQLICSNIKQSNIKNQ
jgi:hypothetical protein